MKKVRILLFAVVALLIMSHFSSIKAAEIVSGEIYPYTVERWKDGQKIAADSYGEGIVVFRFHDDQFEDDMIGTCVQPIVQIDGTGTGEARITKIDNNDILAKVAYYWGIVKGYANDVNAPEFSKLTRANQYTQKPEDTITSMTDSGWSQEAQQNIFDMVDEARNIAVPSSFVVYKGEPTNSKQNFAVFAIHPFSASKKYNDNTPSGLNHAAVTSGNTITYDITWNNGYGTMTITDVLSKGLTYKKGSANIGDPTETKNADGTTTLVWTTTQESGTLTYSAEVTKEDLCVINLTKVQNNATMTVGNEPHFLAALENPIPNKCYAPEPNDGYNHKQVEVGDDIRYQITLPNIKNEAVVIKVSDTLSKGLTYNKDAKVENGTLTSEANPVVDSSKNTTKLEFTVTVPAKGIATLTYSAKVNDAAVKEVQNNATAQYGNEQVIKLNELENPIYIPEEVIPTPDTGTHGALIGVLLGLAISGSGGYLIYRKYKRA
ncbi:MAG: isopeptide-forming domain-containing fimbrial protein [Bacilli bacterium]|nr:isopeptide-forming domain-containing fimbrial protein [Bacilli bacterium]